MPPVEGRPPIVMCAPRREVGHARAGRHGLEQSGASVGRVRSARRAGRVGRAGSLLGSLGAVVGAVLLPKCPMCIAAVLSGAGLGVGAAGRIAPFVRPFAFAISVTSAVAVLVIGRSRRRSAEGGCSFRCGGHSRGGRDRTEIARGRSSGPARSHLASIHPHDRENPDRPRRARARPQRTTSYSSMVVDG